jgi:hypothetical protein
MVRNKTEKSGDTKPKKPLGRKKQIQQVVGPESTDRMEISEKGMFNSMMPMIIMVMMMSIIMPMLKRTAQNDRELEDK